MLSIEFLTDYPLYRKFWVQLPEKLAKDGVPTLTVPAIHLYCPNCASGNTFTTVLTLISAKHRNRSQTIRVPDLLSGRLGLVESLCASCKDYFQFFILYFDEELKYVMKVGQFPSWSISIEKHLEKVLGKHENIYRKGRVCESQGYGIGAYAYYRRIVENIIDDLLKLIEGLFDEDTEKKRFVEALKDVQASTVAKDKIALVKELLPPTIRPDGMNPLSILHDTLSAGIHVMSDEECLEKAIDIREILIYLVEQIGLANEAKLSSARFTQSMRNLLVKRSKDA